VDYLKRPIDQPNRVRPTCRKLAPERIAIRGEVDCEIIAANRAKKTCRVHAKGILQTDERIFDLAWNLAIGVFYVWISLFLPLPAAKEIECQVFPSTAENAG
jgi:hypothetical protein